MGLKAIVAGLVALGLAGAAGPDVSVRYLQGRQAPTGGVAEPGSAANASLTAWTLLGLRAAGAPTDAAYRYVVAHESELDNVQLGVLAEAATGRVSGSLLERLVSVEKPSGAIGETLNSTTWSLLALAQAGRPLPPRAVRYLLRRQARSGGWSWLAGGAPDSNDTAAAIEALRVAGVAGRPIRRGLSYLRRLQRPDGGFPLARGKASDSQSTAWAIQAFLAAGRKPGPSAYAFLARMRRPDGSYRYSATRAITPVWVTAQVLPALTGKPFPLAP